MSIIYIALIVVAVLGTQVHGSLTDQRLEAKLFKDYNKHIRPARNLGHAVKVEFEITLLQLISIAEKSEEMTTSQYITFKWEDPRLTWDPEDYEGVKNIRLPPSLLWTPDVALFNNNDGGYDKRIPVNVVLDHNGKIVWLPPAIYKSACSIAVDYFPFDWQNCTMKFRSFTENSSEVFLVSAKQRVVLDKEAYTDNGEWDIVHCPAKTNFNPDFPYYQDLTLYLIIQRKPLFYITNIIFPCAVISMLSMLVFFLPCHSSEKMNYSLALLLGLPVYLLLLTKRVPETSFGVPLIGTYLLFIMIIVALSIVCTVAVLNVYHTNPAKHKIPPSIRNIFIHRLPPFLRLKKLNIKPVKNENFKFKLNPTDNGDVSACSQTDELVTDFQSQSSWCSTPRCDPAISQNASTLSLNCGGYDLSKKRWSWDDNIHYYPSNDKRFLIPCPSFSTNSSKRSENVYKTVHGYDINKVRRRTSYRRATRADSTTTISTDISSRAELCTVTNDNTNDKENFEEALQNFIFIAGYYQSQRSNKVASQEWQYVAKAMDRLCAFIFIFVTICGTIYFIWKAVTNYPPQYPFNDDDDDYAGCPLTDRV